METGVKLSSINRLVLLEHSRVILGWPPFDSLRLSLAGCHSSSLVQVGGGPPSACLPGPGDSN